MGLHFRSTTVCIDHFRLVPVGDNFTPVCFSSTRPQWYVNFRGEKKKSEEIDILKSGYIVRRWQYFINIQHNTLNACLYLTTYINDAI